MVLTSIGVSCCGELLGHDACHRGHTGRLARDGVERYGLPTLHVKLQPASDVNTEYIVFSSGIDQGIYIDHAEPSLDINREQW